MDSALIEKVARAICRANHVDPDTKGPARRHVIDDNGMARMITDHFGPLWKMWDPHARAAILAMQDYAPERPADLPKSAD